MNAFKLGVNDAKWWNGSGVEMFLSQLQISRPLKTLGLLPTNVDLLRSTMNLSSKSTLARITKRKKDLMGKTWMKCRVEAVEKLGSIASGKHISLSLFSISIKIRVIQSKLFLRYIRSFVFYL